MVLDGAQVPAEVPPVHGRRVVLVPEPSGSPQSMEGMVVDDVDEDSVAAISQFDMTVADSEDKDLHSFPTASPRHRLLGNSDTESLADGVCTFLSLDAVDLHTIFTKRAAMMKAISRFLRGSFRNAMRVALDEALQTNEVRRTRGWKLFLLLPRMLLHRPGRGGNFQK